MQPYPILWPISSPPRSRLLGRVGLSTAGSRECWTGSKDWDGEPHGPGLLSPGCPFLAFWSWSCFAASLTFSLLVKMLVLLKEVKCRKQPPDSGCSVNVGSFLCCCLWLGLVSCWTWWGTVEGEKVMDWKFEKFPWMCWGKKRLGAGLDAGLDRHGVAQGITSGGEESRIQSEQEFRVRRL